MARRPKLENPVKVISETIEILKKLHHERNRLNRPPSTEDEADSKGWKQLDRRKDVFHRFRPGRNNRKYVSPDGHQEAVYDSEGSLVTDPQNEGTYNYAPPSDWAGHFFLDVLSYWMWGNSEDDTTPVIGRIVGSDNLEDIENLQDIAEDAWQGKLLPTPPSKAVPPPAWPPKSVYDIFLEMIGEVLEELPSGKQVYTW